MRTLYSSCPDNTRQDAQIAECGITIIQPNTHIVSLCLNPSLTISSTNKLTMWPLHLSHTDSHNVHNQQMSTDIKRYNLHVLKPKSSLPLIITKRNKLCSPSPHAHTHTYTPSRVLVLSVDTDGLSPAVPLVVIEQSTVLRARHMVMSVRLDCRNWRERIRKRGVRKMWVVEKKASEAGTV